jgi:hypothetical protein
MELIIGLLGMTCILAGFILNVFKKLDSHDRKFLLLNLAGSLLLAWYAIMLSSAPFLILNTVWAAVASWGLIHHEPRMRGHRG